MKQYHFRDIDGFYVTSQECKKITADDVLTKAYKVVNRNIIVDYITHVKQVIYEST